MQRKKNNDLQHEPDPTGQDHAQFCQSALCSIIIRHGRWLLLTECFLFATLAAFVVGIRITAGGDWPAFNAFRIGWIPEAITIIAFLMCGATLIAARRALLSRKAVTAWLLISIGLALFSLAGRIYQFTTLNSSGVLSCYLNGQIFEQEDIYYVQAVSQSLKQFRDDIESRETQSPDGLSDSEQRADLVAETLADNMAVWTEREIGHWLDDQTRQQSLIALLAYQVHPLPSNRSPAKKAIDLEKTFLPRRRDCFRVVEEFCSRKVELFEQQRSNESTAGQPMVASAMDREIQQAESRFQDQLHRTGACDQMMIKPIVALTGDMVTAAECAHSIRTHLARIDTRLQFVTEQIDPMFGQDHPIGLNERFPLFRLPINIPNGNAWLHIYLILAIFQLLHLFVGLVILVVIVVRLRATRRHEGTTFTTPVVLLMFAVWGMTCITGSVANGEDRQGSTTLADVQLNQVSNDVRARLEHVLEFIKSSQWQEAVETLRQVMEDRGDYLIQIPIAFQWEQLGFATFVPLSEYCQMELASWHSRAPEALAIYRRQVDPLAQRWYEQAVIEQDEAKLQQLVHELLLSSTGDQALLRLGAMALERGNYILARRSWEQIDPALRTTAATARLLDCPPGCSWWLALQGQKMNDIWPALSAALQQPDKTPSWLAYPDTEIPLAAVRARLILVSIMEGSLERARLELDLLRRLHPNDQGRFAGRHGTYHELLAEELQASQSWQPRPRPSGWTTLAGAPSRNQISEREIDIARQPAWRTALPRLSAHQDQLAVGQTRVAESINGLLSYHVVADRGRVFIHQPGLLRALDVKTGTPIWPTRSSNRSSNDFESGVFFRLTHRGMAPMLNGTDHTGVPRYCLTVHGNYLVTRMGQAWTTDKPTPQQERTRSCLVGIDLRTQKLLFDRIVPREPGWEFEAAPIIHGSHFFVSLRRHDSVNTQTRVACYAIETGRPVWETPVVRAEAIGKTSHELANGALSFQDDLLFYNTRLGAIAALRASDGRLAWICSYPRSGVAGRGVSRNDRHRFRDLCPSLIHRDLVISAPADCDRIFAIDAGLGRPTWVTAAERAIDAVHLLGVGSDRLLASGDYLYWIDVRSGKLIGQFPSPRSPGDTYAGPSPRGFGRGMLAGPYVYWPTRQGIRVFAQHSPREVRQPIELGTLGVNAGNLLTHDGMLLIVSANQLAAFNQIGRIPQHEAPAKSR